MKIKPLGTADSLRREPVEDVAAERMGFRQARMIEVVARIVGHSDLFHHAARAHVSGTVKETRLSRPSSLKCVMDHGARAFGGQSPAPGIECEPPADFDGGHEGRIEIRNGQPDEADEGLILKQLDGERPIAVAVEVGLSAVDERVGLRG